VLGLIAFGERSGYELSRLAANSVEQLWTPSQSQIYKTLPRLVSRGLIRPRRIGQRDRPDKSLYKIGAAGRKALRVWLDEVEEEPASGRIVFALKLFFCDFASPGSDRAQLAAYRSYLTRRLDRYETLRAGPAALRQRLPRTRPSARHPAHRSNPGVDRRNRGGAGIKYDNLASRSSLTDRPGVRFGRGDRVHACAHVAGTRAERAEQPRRSCGMSVRATAPRRHRETRRDRRGKRSP
jgi:DNA-binding PadR family transcriptional regulator